MNDSGVLAMYEIVGTHHHPKLGFVTESVGMPLYKGHGSNDFTAVSINGAKNAMSLTLFLLSTTPLIVWFLIPWFRRKFIEHMAFIFYKNMNPLWQGMNDDWCLSGKELYRAMGKIPEFQGDYTQHRYNINNKYRMALLSFWEFDNAYRYRGQDILGELKKENLNNPRKELRRLLDLAIEREGYYDLRRKYRRIKTIISLLPASYLRKVAQVLNELDLDKIRLDDDDLAWAKPKNYNFLGKDYQSVYQEALQNKNTDIATYTKMNSTRIPLTPDELDAFNKDLKVLCEKHGVNISIKTDPKLEVTKKHEPETGIANSTQ